jgi:hypothetical protein
MDASRHIRKGSRAICIILVTVLAMAVCCLSWATLVLFDRTRSLESKLTQVEVLQEHFGRQLSEAMSVRVAPNSSARIGDFPPWHGKPPNARREESPGLDDIRPPRQ